MAQVNANIVAIAVPAAAPTSGGAAGLSSATGVTTGVSDSNAPAPAEKTFGQLVTDSGTAPATSGKTSAVLAAASASATDDSQGASPTQPLNVVQVPLLTPAPAVAGIQLAGSPQDLAALAARMQALVQKLQQLQPPVDLNALTGGAGDAAQLSAALQKLGMSPADAASEAGNITTALKTYKSKLSDAGVDTDKLSGAALGTTIGGSTLGQIAAMMMAGSNVPALDSTATLTGQVALTINVTEAKSPATDGISGTAQAMVSVFAQEAELGRDVVGLGSQHASGKVVAEGKAIAAVAVDEKTPIKVELGPQPAAAAAAAQTAQAVTLPGATAAATAAAVAANAPATVTPRNGLSGSAAASATTAVAAKNTLGALKGDVLYRWQADATTGDATVAATPAANKQLATLVGDAASDKTAALAAALASGAGGTGGVTAQAGAETSLAQFADKLATAMRSNVTEQATVQLRGLGQGLQDGTVGGAAGTSGNADAGATGGQIRMLLNPPELGEIRIDLTVKDGSVHGTIAASDSAVVSLLAREVHTLKHGLDQAGLKLGDQGINLMLSNSGQQGQQQSGQQPGQAQNQGTGGGVGTELASDDVEATLNNALGAVSNPANWVSPERVVDMRV